MADIPATGTASIVLSGYATATAGGGTPPPPPPPPVGPTDSLTDDYETLVGGALLRGETITGGTVYAALFTADPGESGDTMAEVSAASYERMAVTFGAPAIDGQFANDSEVLFPVTTEAWGSVTHLALMTAATGGSMIMSMPLNASITVASGEQLRINPGALTVTFS